MLDFEKVGIPEGLDTVLEDNVLLRAYAASSGMRGARIIHRDTKELLGYGSETSIDLALICASRSFVTRELEYDSAIDLNHPDGLYDGFRTEELVTDAPARSKLDEFVMSRGTLCAEREGQGILAWSESLGRESGVVAPTLQVAASVLLRQVAKH